MSFSFFLVISVSLEHQAVAYLVLMQRRPGIAVVSFGSSIRTDRASIKVVSVCGVFQCRESHFGVFLFLR